MVALRKEFGVAPDAISGIAAAAHSATLAPMQTLENNATQPWLIRQMFTDDTAGKVRTVDELVYALYGLTPEEIQIVEGSAK
jgi:hypothetical protein